MCSRYYIELGMMDEISRVVQNIDGRIRLAQGDIRPTDVAPVIGQSEHGLTKMSSIFSIKIYIFVLPCQCVVYLRQQNTERRKSWETKQGNGSFME